MRALAACPWVRGVEGIFASSERKARDGAQILADGLGIGRYGVVDDLGENDRSATGYLPGREFEATVDAFFAQPQTSVRGWESAVDAQARIIRAIDRIVSQVAGDVRQGESETPALWMALDRRADNRALADPHA